MRYKRDFYLIANDSDWEDFRQDFTVGIVLKYSPQLGDEVDMEHIRILQKKYDEQQKQKAKNKPVQKQERPRMSKTNEEQLLYRKKEKKKDRTPNRKEPKFPRFLEDDYNKNYTDNDVSAYSAGGESESKSISNPDFLKPDYNPKQTGEGISSDEEAKFVTPRDKKGRNGRKKNKRDVHNLTPNAYEGGSAMNASFINTKESGLQSFQKSKRLKKKTATPRPDQNSLNRTFLGRQALLVDSKGRALRKASDASDEENEQQRVSHRSNSPEGRVQNYSSLDIYNVVGLINPRND